MLIVYRFCQRAWSNPAASHRHRWCGFFYAVANSCSLFSRRRTNRRRYSNSSNESVPWTQPGITVLTHILHVLQLSLGHPPYLHLATSEMWCWSGGRGILTELSLCCSVVYNYNGAQWRRQLGRPRITWLSTIQQDLKHHHLTLPEAADLAQNRPLWRIMSTYGATQSWVARQKRRRRRRNFVKTR